MFRAALFIIDKTWKPPRCPSVGERISKFVQSDNETLVSAKKKWAIKLWKEVEGT
jgi:hypothetical protein